MQQIFQILTIGLDEVDLVGIAQAPLSVNHMRIQLCLVLDCLRLDVPNEHDFVVRGLHEKRRVGRAPAYRCNVLVRERQQF